jgi:hypothetical protein
MSHKPTSTLPTETNFRDSACLVYFETGLKSFGPILEVQPVRLRIRLRHRDSGGQLKAPPIEAHVPLRVTPTALSVEDHEATRFVPLLSRPLFVWRDHLPGPLLRRAPRLPMAQPQRSRHCGRV